MVNAPSVSGSESEEGQGIGRLQVGQTQTPTWATLDQSEQTLNSITTEEGTLTEAQRHSDISTQTEPDSQEKPQTLETQTQTTN